MEFSKLSKNDKLAVYGSAAVIIGGLVGIGAAGLGILAIVAAVGMLAVVFLPQMSPGTNLPGSKGSLMLILGGVAAVILVLGLLSILSALGILLQFGGLNTIFYLIAVAGGVLMAWAGWQEFQAEGGKFQIGTSSAAAPPPAESRAPATPAAPDADPTPAEPATIEPNPDSTDDRPGA